MSYVYVMQVVQGTVVRLMDHGVYKSTDKPHPRGEILVKNQWLCRGYLNRKDLTSTTWTVSEIRAGFQFFLF